LSDVQVEVGEGVAFVTLNRPHAKNALTRSMAEELIDGLVKLGRDEAVRSLLFTGSGGAFCAGADVREMSTGEDRTVEDKRSGMEIFRRLAEEMYRMDKPIVAAIDGVAYGGGFSLALLADIVIATERARFSMVFGRMGLIPDMGAMYTLPRAVGMQRAKELILSGREISAADARDYGIVLEVHPVDKMLPRAHAIAHSLACASPVAMSMVRRTLQNAFQTDLTNILEVESCGQPIAASSEFSKEAKNRFARKEPSTFRWPPHPVNGV
jgi:2-(1,2-epoxy-1,2-dihydrophenyl)acetyl-CoA isomerase